MITLTPAALEQVKKSAPEDASPELALRLAAKKNPDGSMEYGMGFDESNDDDLVFKFDGLVVVMGGEYGPLFNGTTIDFVEIEPGSFGFIFMNPNDANYRPADSDAGCGSGGCSSCN